MRTKGSISLVVVSIVGASGPFSPHAHGGELPATPLKELRVAQGQSSADSGTAQTSEPLFSPSKQSASDEDKTRGGLTEIVVTAQKREERLQDVPVPVTAIRADSIINTNQVRLQDYFTKVPSLDVGEDPSGRGADLTIRGISSFSGTSAAVGIILDDTPYAFTGSVVVPEIDPNDLARLEILRGPQGTLYGASSMGGLIKYITRDPSLDRLSGDARVGTSAVRNGDGVGYSLRGGINVPLSDTFAIRASAFTREEPGYIDDVAHNQEGTNKRTASGGRLSALWRPSEVFSVKLNAMLDEYELHGSNLIDPTLGELVSLARPLADPGPQFNRRTQLYSATLSANLGRIELTSVSSHSTGTSKLYRELTEFYGTGALDFFGVPFTVETFEDDADKISQEIRLAAPLGHRIVARVGAFYQKERINKDTDDFVAYAANEAGEFVGEGVVEDYGDAFKEYAAFANLTFQITDRFDLELGVRQSHLEQDFDAYMARGPYASGFYGVPERGGIFRPALNAESDVFTYLITPRVKLLPDLMLYARLASGYRPGSANLPSATACPGCPTQFGPDKTENYEFGVKGTFYDRRVSVDTSIYWIDWVNLQTTVRSPLGWPYTTNVGEAQSKGVELAIDLRPLPGLTIAASGAWNDTRVTEYPADATVPVVVGDEVCCTSPFTGRLSLDHQFNLTSNLIGTVGASVNRVGRRLSPLGRVPRDVYEAYTRVDLNATVTFDTWTTSLHMNNVTDELKKLSYSFPSGGFLYTQPRTIGLSISKSF